MQALISRFGGTPALILKLAFLGLINGAAIWALPPLYISQSWLMLAVLVVATFALDFFLLGRRLVPAKYVVIGAILLTIFQLIPIVYTISIAFTNHSTGHIGTREEAIAAIQRDSLSESEQSTYYEMLPLYSEADDFVVALTQIPQVADDAGLGETGDLGEMTDETVTEFGPVDEASPEPSVQFEFGGEDAAQAAPSVAPEESAPAESAVAVEPPGGWPPTFIGTNDGLDQVDPGDVERNAEGVVTGVVGFRAVPEADLPGLDSELASLKAPGPNGGYIVAQGFTMATELMPIVTYDEAADTFTNTATGVVYEDNGRGSFVNPANPDDELLPGWKVSVGLANFTRIFSDPDISGPFVSVFLWTFTYAFLTVILTFALGLTLAIALNKPGMRGQRIYRSLLIIPYAVPAFLSVLVFAGLLNDDFGAINSTLGINVPWLFDPFWAKVSTLIVNLWLGVPYMFLVSTGALQAIPSELQEAARIDGARNFQVFRKVNLPLLLIALTPLLVASFAFNFNNFNNIYLLTGGGPAMDGSSVAGATDILISYTYKIAFAAGKGNDFGLASAISIIIFLIVGTISGISFARSKALREER